MKKGIPFGARYRDHNGLFFSFSLCWSQCFGSQLIPLPCFFLFFLFFSPFLHLSLVYLHFQQQQQPQLMLQCFNRRQKNMARIWILALVGKIFLLLLLPTKKWLLFGSVFWLVHCTVFGTTVLFDCVFYILLFKWTC